jgi:hypothetical protein
MKPELVHLLQTLKSAHPDFQNIVIFPNGLAIASLRYGTLRFESLDDLESYAWPQSGSKNPQPITPTL